GATGSGAGQGGGARPRFGSPRVADRGEPKFLLCTPAGVAGPDPATGKLLWTFPWTNPEATNCSQPIPLPGGGSRILVSSGYGAGSALFQVERQDGVWSPRLVWKSRELRTKFTTAVLHRGHAYGLDDGVLACLNLDTGKRVWRKGRYGHGQILLASELLLIQAEPGDVVLVEPSPDGLRELGRIAAALPGKTWNNPALAGRFLL